MPRRLLHIISSSIRPAHEAGAVRQAWPELLAIRELALCDPQWQHLLLLLGTTTDARDATALGITPDVRLAPLLGRARLSLRTIERVIDELDPDAVVVWDPSLAPAIARLPILPERFARVDFSSGEIECRGVQPETGEIIRHWRHLSPAALDTPALAHREALRERLALSPDDVLIAVSGTMPDTAMVLAFVLCALGVAGIPCVGLAHSRVPGRATMLRHLREGDLMRRVIFTSRPLPLLASACDFILHPLPDESQMDLGEACILRHVMRLGVPVLTRADSFAELPVRPDCFLESASPRSLAACAYRLLSSPGALTDLRQRLAGTKDTGATIGHQLRLAMRDLEALQ
jgi:hypothetical protein